MLNGKLFKRCLTLGWFILLWSCTVSIPEPESPTAKIYTKKCSRCHSVPHPKSHTYKEWECYFELIKIYADNKATSPNIISESEKEDLLRYLKKHSK